MVVNESSNTICTICYAHLKPPNEAIQAISICGHVFHDLCLKQWLDYCIKNTTIATCPVCKQKFSRENITRLYFQSTGMTGTDEEEWRLLCIKVNKSPQESEDNITEQLRKWKEEARREMCMKNKALQEKELNQTLLEIRSQDLVQAESDRVMLQQGAASSSQPQALGVTGGMSQNITARNCDDIAYLAAVMNKFQDNSEKYEEFIQVLKDFKAKYEMEIQDVKSRVIDLLKGHADDLILGFNTFLPTGDGITLDLVMDDLPRRSMGSIINFVNKVKTNCEDHVYRSFLGILNMHRSNSTSTVAEVQQKITDLFQHHHHPDLVDELNNFLPH
ncbi:hypothetical protein MKW98_009993 [Papaver atlanticum]|uniref:RING-type domain-containing protein n=1 Tax=Papaver atlanticum TaxID=357466 RepID=A0AAD4RXN2_9MAGN|nr:hypothetical protein MKW98_009993 [Papaver atlanticum]